jgi:hypothetical protein
MKQEEPDLAITPYSEENEQTKAKGILVQFCEDFSEYEIHAKIDLAAKTCLTADVPDFEKAASRQDICYVFEKISKVVSSIFTIYGKSAA